LFYFIINRSFFDKYYLSEKGLTSGSKFDRDFLRKGEFEDNLNLNDDEDDDDEFFDIRFSGSCFDFLKGEEDF
jgi:hypothetical protein